MTDEFGLEKLHRKLFVIINEIDHICKDDNLKFFLSDGYALGAVCRNGFIPCDDDTLYQRRKGGIKHE